MPEIVVELDLDRINCIQWLALYKKPPWKRRKEAEILQSHVCQYEKRKGER